MVETGIDYGRRLGLISVARSKRILRGILRREPTVGELDEFCVGVEQGVGR